MTGTASKWPIKNFGDVVVNKDSQRVPLKEADRSKRKGIFPYYGASGVIDYIDEYIFEGDHLLIGEDGANLLARATPIAFIGKGKFWVNNHAHIVAPTDKIDLKYLERFFSTIDLRPYVTGSAQPKLTRKNLDRIQIPLPPLPEQRRIAAILDKAHAIRRKRQEALALTDEFLRSAFLEMFGDPVTNPKGWPIRKVGNIGAVQGGAQVTHRRTSYPVEVPYLRVANVYRDNLALDEIKIIRVTRGELERLTLERGDLLIVEGHGNRAEVGRSAVWDGSIDPCIHQNHLIRVRLDRKVAEPSFVSTYLNSPGGRRQLFRFGKTTSGLNTISTSNVRSTLVFVPPLDAQHQFLSIVGRMGLLRNHLCSYSRMNNDLFNSLVHRAFHGEL